MASVEEAKAGIHAIDDDYERAVAGAHQSHDGVSRAAGLIAEVLEELMVSEGGTIQVGLTMASARDRALAVLRGSDYADEVAAVHQQVIGEVDTAAGNFEPVIADLRELQGRIMLLGAGVEMTPELVAQARQRANEAAAEW